MIKALTIANGIIQNKEIDGIPVKLAIVQPRGARNVRTLIKMKKIIGITNHNTANTAPTAGDEQHAKYLQNVENADTQYVSVHLFVDEDSITQCIPLDESCYHAGDGNGDGNRKTIGIEICENGDTAKTELNAQKLNAALLMTYPHLKIFKHQDWSGKFCPRVILGRGGWNDFKAGIYNLVGNAKNNTVPNEVSDWAKEAAEWVKEMGISDGSNPKGDLTREQMWVMLHRFYKKMKGE